jgi:hypothetical protein
MAIHWQVKFRSLRANTLYTANIYDNSYSGYPVQLQGAEKTFETQEDDSDDFFAPVRRQSGYLRIVDTGKDNDGNTFNWRNIIADTDTSRPVTLTDDKGVVRWQGFMQPQNFGVDLYMSPQAIEFPLQCPISITDGININYNLTPIRNFAYLLKSIVDSIPTVAPTFFVFQGGDRAMNILLKRIDWQNFVLDGDDEGDEGMTMYDCLEGMCSFWGWTLREHERTWYFTCADDSAAMSSGLILTKTELDAVASETMTWKASKSIYVSRTVGDIFASTNNIDKQVRGPRKVVITSKANIADDFIIDPFDSLLEETMNEAGWRYGVPYGEQTIAQTNNVYDATRRNFVFQCYFPNAAFRQVRKYEGAENGYGSSINVLAINRTGSPTISRFASFETRYMHGFSDGFFVLNGKTYLGAEEFVETDHGVPVREMFMALGIGKDRDSAKWWNGRAWQDSYTRFTVAVGEENKPGYFTRYWVNGQNWIDSYIIAVGSALQGYLFGDFFGSYAGAYGDRSIPETGSEKSFNLKDFAVRFYKNSVTVCNAFESGWCIITEKKDKSEGRYIATNSNRTRDEYTSDNIFASDNMMKPGYGIVMNTDGSPLTIFDYANGAARPEQHKADRIAAYWSSSKRSIECELLSNGSIGVDVTASSISPLSMVVIDGTTLYPYSIGHDYWNDVVKLVSIEM